MKKLLFTLVISISSALTVSAQNATLKNGFYYSADGNLFTGTCSSHFENGKTKSTFDVVDGKIKDAVTYYYENGNVMETGAFNNNDKDGQWLRWDEAGHKIAEAYYVSGKKNGTWLVWDSQGIKRYEMHYEMSAKVGTWYMWDENGKLTSEKNYNAL